LRAKVILIIAFIFALFPIVYAPNVAYADTINLPWGLGSQYVGDDATIITVGDTVCWDWDFIFHTVTSGIREAADTRFQSSALLPGGSQYCVTFDKVGDFPYFCQPHFNMFGIVIVQSAAGLPVGGTSIPIEQTSLILTGAQMTASWLIPVIVAGAGIVLVFVRKSKNS